MNPATAKELDDIEVAAEDDIINGEDNEEFSEEYMNKYGRDMSNYPENIKQLKFSKDVLKMVIKTNKLIIISEELVPCSTLKVG